jgi:hypothetical protein
MWTSNLSPWGLSIKENRWFLSMCFLMVFAIEWSSNGLLPFISPNGFSPYISPYGFSPSPYGFSPYIYISLWIFAVYISLWIFAVYISLWIFAVCTRTYVYPSGFLPSSHTLMSFDRSLTGAHEIPTDTLPPKYSSGYTFYFRYL